MTAYPRLSIENFGRQLIESRDLDPVYVALSSLPIPSDQLHRWLLAYWCFYHCGVACYLSEREGWDDWWNVVNDEYYLFDAPRWPRGRERRHFRGKLARYSLSYLIGFSTPEAIVKTFIEQAPDYKLVSGAVQSLIGFGPWIAFKIADMLERVCGVPVDFEQAHIFMFKDPRQAALRLWAEKTKQPPRARPKNEGETIKKVVDYLQNEFHSLLAPPHDDRPVGLQEIETILCKWKSHMNGHYPLFNDTREIREGLKPWTDVSETARKFLAKMPREEGVVV